MSTASFRLGRILVRRALSNRTVAPLLPSHRFQSTLSRSTPFLLADIGEGIAEVELLQWFTSPGESLSQFDRVCQVQSDKASVEITSRYDGAVERLCAQVGDMIKVGEPLLYVTTPGTADERANEKEVDKSPVQETSSFVDTTDGARSSENGRALSSPAVRRLGRENGIDLSTVRGSGPHGRVLKADLLNMISTGREILRPVVAEPTETHLETRVSIRGYHRLMVGSMTSSLSVPHMIFTDEVDVSSLLDVRSALKSKTDVALTLLPFFLKITSLALCRFPMMNGSIDVERMEMVLHPNHDLGVAVDTERGLVVVVVRGCERRTVQEIAVELGRLVTSATEGNLLEEDVKDPTFTLSNIGAIGGGFMSPVVIPPQVAIGAMGKIQRLPRFVGNDSLQVEAVRIMPMSWGGDHRAIDGATLARFSNLWKYYCENPEAMMFEMR